MRIHYFIWVLALLAACSQRSKQEEKVVEPSIPVRLVKVENVVRTEPVITVGMVASREEARLSFKIGGVIDKIYVREGQEVHDGQLLAALHLNEIEAQVNQAELTLAKTRRDLERVGNMLRDTAATLEQFQNAKTGVDAALENLNIVRFNRDFAKISSPVTGTIVKKLMHEGEVTVPGSPVLVVVSNRKSDWVVKVGVSDRDWARLKPNDLAEVGFEAYPGEKFTGNVLFLSQAADPVTHLYEVEIRLTGAVPKMASGLFAKVRLWPSGSRSYRVIPVEALIEGHGDDGFVFVVEDGIAKKKTVKIGHLEGDRVLLTAGPDTTAAVVAGGNAFLKDGISVYVP